MACVLCVTCIESSLSWDGCAGGRWKARRRSVKCSDGPDTPLNEVAIIPVPPCSEEPNGEQGALLFVYSECEYEV